MYTLNDKVPVRGIRHAQDVAKDVSRRDKREIESNNIIWWRLLLNRFSQGNEAYHEIFHEEMKRTVSRVTKAITEMNDYGVGESYSQERLLQLVCKPDKEGVGPDHGSITYVTPVKMVFDNGRQGNRTLDLEISSGLILTNLENQYALSVNVRPESNNFFDQSLVSFYRFNRGQNIGGKDLERPSVSKLRDNIYKMIDRHAVYTQLSERLTQMVVKNE